MPPYFTPVSPDNPFRKRIKHTRTDQFLYQEKSVDKDDNPYDYTGHTFKMQIKEFQDGPVVVEIPNASFTISQDADGVAAAVNNIFTIDHPPADFADLIAEPFEYYFDIQFEDASGKPFTPIVGEFIIRGD